VARRPLLRDGTSLVNEGEVQRGGCKKALMVELVRTTHRKRRCAHRACFRLR
jgi:hypothetical protein